MRFETRPVAPAASPPRACTSRPLALAAKRGKLQLSKSMTDTSFTLRPLHPDDRERLVEISSEAFREPVDRIWGWDAQEHRRARLEDFAKYDGLIQVIELDGQVAGELTVRRRPDQIALVMLCLAAEVRGRGIGARIVSELLEEARSANLPLTLRVLRHNRARELYERHGMVVIHETDERFWMSSRPELQHELL